MEFIDYMNAWVKSELTQGRIMVGIGLLLLVALFFIFKSQHELLRGAMIPLALLTLVLVGYGGSILYSRPAHAKASIERYQQSQEDAIEQEIAKHINDNKAGNMLMKWVYPSIMLLSLIVLVLVGSFYYKGMAIGFILLAASIYIIDYGFVSRSDAFIAFLNG